MVSALVSVSLPCIPLPLSRSLSLSLSLSAPSRSKMATGSKLLTTCSPATGEAYYQPANSLLHLVMADGGIGIPISLRHGLPPPPLSCDC